MVGCFTALLPIILSYQKCHAGVAILHHPIKVLLRVLRMAEVASFRAVRIPSKLNVEADHLSRLEFKKFQLVRLNSHERKFTQREVKFILALFRVSMLSATTLFAKILRAKHFSRSAVFCDRYIMRIVDCIRSTRISIINYRIIYKT